MKKSMAFLVFLATLFSINFVSAQTFSLSEFFYNIDPSTMILGMVFVISFALLNFSLNRALRGNQTTSAIVSICISLLIVYGINLSGFNYENWIYGIGISSDILYTIALVVVPIISLVIFFQHGFGVLLLSLGGLAGIMAYFAYEKTILMTVAIILIIIGAILAIRKRIREKRRRFDVRLR